MRRGTIMDTLTKNYTLSYEFKKQQMSVVLKQEDRYIRTDIYSFFRLLDNDKYCLELHITNTTTSDIDELMLLLTSVCQLVLKFEFSNLLRLLGIEEKLCCHIMPDRIVMGIWYSEWKLASNIKEYDKNAFVREGDPNYIFKSSWLSAKIEELTNKGYTVLVDSNAFYRNIG